MLSVCGQTLLGLFLGAALASAAIIEVNCGAWISGSAVTVSINSGEQALLSGCVAEGVNVTLQCASGSSVLLQDWAAPAVGWVSVVGSATSTSWALTDVDVTVNNSVIVATAGPAVGAAAIVGGGVTSVAVQNVTIRVTGKSRLESRGNDATCAAGIVVVGGGASGLSLSIANVTIAAQGSELVAMSPTGVAAVLGVALQLIAGSASGSAVISNVTLVASSVEAKAQAASASTSMGFVMTGAAWGDIAMSGITVQAGCSPLRAAAAAAGVGAIAVAAVGGVAAQGGTAMLLSVVSSSWIMERCSVICEATAPAQAVIASAGAVSATTASQLSVVDLVLFFSNSTIVASASSSGGTATAGLAGSVAVSICSVLLSMETVLIVFNTTSLVVSGSGGSTAVGIGGSLSSSQCAAASQTSIAVWMESSNISANCAASASSNSFATSAIAGSVAAGVATGTVEQSNVTAWSRFSSVSSTSGGISTTATCYAASAAMLGNAVASTGALLLQSDVSTWVIDSAVVAVCDASNAMAGVAIAGMAVSNSTARQQQTGSTVVIASSTVNASSSQNNITYAAAAIGGIAGGIIGSQWHGNSSVWIVSSNATVEANSGPNAQYAGASLAGVAGADIYNTVQLQVNITVWIISSDATVSCSSPDGVTATTASAVAGVSSVFPYTSQTQNSVAVWMCYSRINSNAATGSGVAVSSVAAIVGGSASGDQLQQGVTVVIVSTNVICVATSPATASDAFTVAAIAGLAIAYSDPSASQAQQNVSVWASASSVECATYSTGDISASASAIAGIAVLQDVSGGSQEQANVYVWIDVSNISCLCIAGVSGTPASAIVGIAGYWTGGGQQVQSNVSLWANSSNISSLATCGSTSFASSSILASTGYWYGNGGLQQQTNVSFWIVSSTVSSISLSGATSTSQSSIAGLACNWQDNNAQTQQAVTGWITASNVNSTCVAPGSSECASSFLGVSGNWYTNVGTQLQQYVSAWIGVSNITCNSVTGADSYSASAIVSNASGFGPGSTSQSGVKVWVGTSADVASSSSTWTWLSCTQLLSYSVSYDSSATAALVSISSDGGLSGGSCPAATTNGAITETAECCSTATATQQAAAADQVVLPVYVSPPGTSAPAVAPTLPLTPLLVSASGVCDLYHTHTVSRSETVTPTISLRTSASTTVALTHSDANLSYTVSTTTTRSDLTKSENSTVTQEPVSTVTRSLSPTLSANQTVSLSRTVTPRRTPTPSRSATPVFVPRVTPTRTPTPTPSKTRSDRPLPTPTPTRTPMPSDTLSALPKLTATATALQSVSRNFTSTPSQSETRFLSNTSSISASCTATPTSTIPASTAPAVLLVNATTLSPYCGLAAGANLFIPASYAPCCTNISVMSSTVATCLQNMQSCAAGVHFNVTSGAAVNFSDNARSVTADRCNTLVQGCVGTYVACLQGATEGPVGATCPWFAAMSSYERQAVTSWAGSELESSCTNYVSEVVNTSGCTGLLSVTYEQNVCVQPKNAPLTLGESVAAAAGVPVVNGATQPGSVPATGLAGLAVQGEECSGCVRYLGSFCYCDTSTMFATSFAVYSHGLVDGAPGNDCARGLYRLDFCSAKGQPNGSTTGYVESAVALQLPNAASQRRQSGSNGSCVSGNPVLGGACGCPAQTTSRRLPLATASASGYVVHANFTFCALPTVTVMVLASQGGGCLQPLGANYTCECAAGSDYVSTEVAYYNETVGRYEAGVLVICGAVAAVTAGAQAVVTTAGTILVAGVSGGAAGLIQGASMVMLAPCGSATSNAAAVGAQGSVTPFAIPGTGRMGNLLGLIVLAVSFFSAHALSVSAMALYLVYVRGKRQPCDATSTDAVCEVPAVELVPSPVEDTSLVPSKYRANEEPEGEHDTLPVPDVPIDPSKYRANEEPEVEHDTLPVPDVCQSRSHEEVELPWVLTDMEEDGDTHPASSAAAVDSSPPCVEVAMPGSVIEAHEENLLSAPTAAPCTNRDDSGQAQPATAKDAEPREGGPLEQSCVKLRFPNLSLKLFYFVFQGVVYESLLLIRNSERTVGEVVLGVVCILFAMVFMWFVHWYGTMVGRDAELLTRSFVSYDGLFARVPVLLRRTLLPTGFWMPNDFLRRYGEMYTSFDGGRAKVIPPYGLWRAIVIALLVVIGPNSEAGCNAILLVMALVFFGLAIMIGVTRPHRMPHEDLAAALLNLMSGLLALASTGWADVNTESLYLGIVYIAIIGVLIMAVIRVIEIVYWEPATLKIKKSTPLSADNSTPPAHDEASPN